MVTKTNRRNSMLQILDLYYITQLRGMHHNITLDGRISLLPNFNQQDLNACIAKFRNRIWFFHLNSFLARSKYSFKLHFLYVLLVDVFGFLHILLAFFGNRAGGGVELKYDWLWGRIILSYLVVPWACIHLVMFVQYQSVFGCYWVCLSCCLM